MISKLKIPRCLPWPGLALLFASCHMVIDLDRRQLPNKDSSTTVCTTAADCDDGSECTEDWCDLFAGLCTHFLMAADTICGPADGICDEAERCDGVNPECPDDELKPATEVCRESIDPSGTCDPPEYCTGDSKDCPEDFVEEETAPCDDNDECTYDDTCDGLGACRGTNGLSGVVNISAAGKGTHTCSLLFSGLEARCWGSGSFYQLGNGTADSSPSPIKVLGLPVDKDFLQVSSGGFHTCVLLHSGRIMCWGRNDFGQVGTGTTGPQVREPMEILEVGLFPAWDYVSAGYFHTCAIHRYEGLFCWGANDRGQLGDGTTETSMEPTAVTGLSSRALTVSAGLSHTCAVLDDGGVQCWGDDSSGQIGNEIVEEFTSMPTDVVGLPADPLAVSLGLAHTCALLSNGEVMCWGENGRGQLGDGAGTGGSTPVVVNLPAAARTASSVSSSILSSGEDHTCVLLDDGQVQCWGAGNDGQLGNDAETDQSEPVGVTGLSTGVTAVSCGSTYSCALFETGTVHCWGSNNAGQLGDGSNDGSLVPVQVLCE